MVKKQTEKCRGPITTCLQKVSIPILMGALGQLYSHMAHPLVRVFFPEIESIENRQTHSCQFVQSCGFCQGLQTRAGLPDNEGKLFQFLWVQSASAEFWFQTNE